MKRDTAALVAIAGVIGIFFFRLFWPEPQLIVTPDFGRSDAWHFSFATKLALAQSFKRDELPIWEPRMGMGFPLFAEGQAGALFLPNLLLLKYIRDPVIAYNATYVVLFLILGWGMYAWLRAVRCTRLASLFGATTLVFSGQTIPRLPHHTLLESLALTPLLMALAHQVLTKNHSVWMSIFAFTLSQQLFTGSPQPVLLTLLMIGVYAVLTRGRLARLALGIIVGIGIAAVQLLPSAEMLRESTSPNGFSPEEASYYSFPLVHLKTLVAPFILGNPKLGTYPPFTEFDGSIFWENNLFIGWLPFLLFLFGLLQKSKLRVFIVILTIASFLLMLGEHSPLYLLYSVWPLSLFRVPSRFAWIFVFVLVNLASVTISKLSTRIVMLLLAIQTVWLVTSWWNYQALAPVRGWLGETQFLERIRATGTPLRTIGSELVHNRQFLKNGWRGNLAVYKFLRNVPAPNSNLYWNVTQTDVYAGRFLKRPALVESLLGNEIKISDSVATISAQGKRLLDLYHAGTIVTALPLDMETPMPEVASTKSADLAITAYRNPDALPRAYLTGKTIFAPTLTETAEALAGKTFIPGKTVVVHDETLSMDEEDVAGTVVITNETPTRILMRAAVDVPRAILVFGDTYYPGWNAFVDGQRTEIFPVNIKERGIHVTKGSHEVLWQYRPTSLGVGAWISVLSLIGVGYPALAWLFRRRS